MYAHVYEGVTSDQIILHQANALNKEVLFCGICAYESL